MNLMFFNYDPVSVDNLIYYTTKAIKSGEISPDQFLWLIENQFDIFKLIESGFAIKKRGDERNSLNQNI